MRFPLMLAAVLATPVSAAPPPAQPLILAFGDSLTAGYGLAPGLGFAPQLEATLRRHGIAARVVDAGVSGDTTTGGRARLGWTLSGLPRSPDFVILELGGNDMLRALDPALAKANLDAILTELNRRHIPVLLAGMRAARNLDPAYRAKFDALYPALAVAHRTALYPFFMDGVVGQPGLQQGDGIHPTFAGVKRITLAILPSVLKALGR